MGGKEGKGGGKRRVREVSPEGVSGEGGMGTGEAVGNTECQKAKVVTFADSMQRRPMCYNMGFVQHNAWCCNRVSIGESA